MGKRRPTNVVDCRRRQLSDLVHEFIVGDNEILTQEVDQSLRTLNIIRTECEGLGDTQLQWLAQTAIDSTICMEQLAKSLRLILRQLQKSDAIDAFSQTDQR